MLKELVVATHNEGKLKEIASMLAEFPIRFHSCASLGLASPEETGDTFEANALLKARAARNASGLPALSDDSGLCIDVLGGLPGVYTADWAGEPRDYRTAFARIEKELDGRQSDASFVCMLALALPDGTEHVFEGRVQGTLTLPPRGNNGFGYDPVFIPEGHTQTFGELPPEAKKSLSHRARAFTLFAEYLRA